MTNITACRFQWTVFAVALGLAFLIQGAGHDPARAQSAIKVLVNNEPITTYDVSNRAKFVSLISGGRVGEARAIEELIDERLKLQEAKRLNISISKAQIDEALASMARRSNMTGEKLEAALRQSGVDPATLRTRIQAELAWNEIVRTRFRATVRITDQDVAAALGEDAAAAEGTISQYDLQPIIFVVPERASQAYGDQRKLEADAFRSRYAGCDAALELAKGLKDVVVQDMVRRDESQLAEPFRGAITEAEVGTATRPVKMAQGYQLFGICEKRAIRGSNQALGEARVELMNERGQLLARRYLRDLRSDAVIDYR